MDAVGAMGHVIKKERGADRGQGRTRGCAKLVVFANAPEDNPFMAARSTASGEGDRVNVGVSGPGVVRHRRGGRLRFNRAGGNHQAHRL